MRRLLLPALLAAASPAGAGCLFLENGPAAANLTGAMLARVSADCAAAGLDFSAPLESGDAPFRRIIVFGASPEAVSIALAAGADPDIADASGSPAFVDLINFDSGKDAPETLGILRLLGEAGADFSRPDAYGDLALSKAAGGGEIETVRVLLDYGADPNGLNTYDRTPLFETVFGNCLPEIGALLIERGARLDPMPEDQIARLFEEAAKTCAHAPGGADYIARLKGMRG